MQIILLSTTALFSLYLIAKAADLFVDGAAALAKRLGVAPFVIGVSVIAVGTSAPELAVNVIAALHGATELSVGNILGSNIINLLLGLGISALFVPLAVHSRTVWKEFPFMLLSAFVLLFVGAGALFSGVGDRVIDRADALVLLSFFTIFLVYTFGMGRQNGSATEEVPALSPRQITLYIAGGLFGLVAGGKLLVSAAVDLASLLGVSQNLIGLTVVAVGTSLPEVLTTITAVRKGMVDLGVGGIIGTNIFNIFLILGVTALIHPITFTDANVTDALVLIVASVFLFATMFVGRRHVLQRWQGVGMVLLYVAYFVFVIWRG